VRIKYNEFVANPVLRNTIVNLPAHVCQSLIAQGVAVGVPYKNLADRIQSEQALLPKPAPPVVEWGIQKGSLSEYSRPAIIRRDANGVTYFASPTPDTPPAIAEHFRQLTDGAVQELSPDHAAMLAEAAFVGDSNKHRPVCVGKDKEGKPLLVNEHGEFVKK